MTLSEFEAAYPETGITQIDHDHRTIDEVIAGLDKRADVYVVEDGLVVRERGSATARLLRIRGAGHSGV